MIKTLLLDTDVVIDYLRDFQLAIEYIENLNEKLILSVLTVAELYSGIRNKKEQNAIDKFLSVFQIVALDAEIAQLGGSFRQKYGKSHGVGLADALIAATAAHENANLVTLNVRHYPMLKPISPYRKH